MDKKYFCRNCKGLRNHKEMFSKKTRGEDDIDYFMWIEDYFVIECLGCETISFLRIYGDTDMSYYDDEGKHQYYFNEYIYPEYIEKGNEIERIGYLPKKIKLIYEETIDALKSNSYILTAGGLRAIIEAICNHLKIKKGNLEERIDSLHSKSHLTLSESKRLHSIRFLGNDALHEMEIPKKEQLYILLEIVNHLLLNLFINDKLIQGKVDTVIDNYDEFIRLLNNKIKKEMLEKHYTLNQLLGNSKRLIAKKNFSIFEKKLIEEIENGEIDYLSITSKNTETFYKIEKEPELSLHWF
ncbi:DUF4145 domain-containing protein [Flavobacterium rakeshii]|uniref:DUF4145 domain-containing protein n=1 Tax=Flavobacterium rakeshii TaxID=1038845 RepID=A0A6N8HB03_9FLAO|nr:DUF4145 domain-containing protein [Flavobacterium rakeshii]MUV02336.1 DUF4145 domain-containing protein [Flavobacterium rakeshii]